MSDAHSQYVPHKQERYQQARGQLDALGPADAQRPPPDKFQNAQNEMDNGRAKQDDSAGEASGHGGAVAARPFHGFDGNQTQRMVQQMRGEKGKEDESGHQPGGLNPGSDAERSSCCWAVRQRL